MEAVGLSVRTKLFWNFVTGLFIGAFLFALAAQAESRSAPATASLDQQCAELVRECFGYGPEERTNCYYSSATHPFCEGTELGKLTFKRWTLSPAKMPGNEEAKALLGPQLVDQACLNNFDNQWFSNVIDSTLSAKAIAGLDSTLAECKRKIPVNLPRP